MKLSRVLLSFFFFSSPPPPLSKSRLRFISRVFYSNRASSLSPYSHVRNPSSSLPDVSTIYHSRFRNIYIREGKVTERNERQMRSARPWRVSWNGQIALVLFRRETDPRLLVSSSGDARDFAMHPQWEIFLGSRNSRVSRGRKRESRSIDIANRDHGCSCGTSIRALSPRPDPTPPDLLHVT